MVETFLSTLLLMFISSRYFHHNARTYIHNASQQTFLVFQDVFSVTLIVFQDVFKTYLQYIFLKRLQDVFRTFSRRLQDVFQDVFKTCLQDVLQLCLQDVLEDKKNVTLKTSSRRLQDVFSMSSPRRRFTGMNVEIQKVIL